MFDHGVGRGRALGAEVLAQLLGQVPARPGVWRRSLPRHRAELALDTGASAVHAMLH